jgi:hypothetical protein
VGPWGFVGSDTASLRAAGDDGGSRQEAIAESLAAWAAPLWMTTAACGKPAMVEADGRGASASLALVSQGMSCSGGIWIDGTISEAWCQSFSFDV